MKSRINVRQRDITDCGAACLSSISAYYGLHVSVAKIRQMASTDKKGTNVVGLQEAAFRLGFQTKAVKSLNADGTIKVEPLQKIPIPAIAHTIVKGQLHHYVVIYGVSKSSVKIMDPRTGQMMQVKISEFIKEWTGILLLLMPADSFRPGKEKTSILRRFMFLLKPHRKVVLQAIFGAMVYTLLGLGTSIYVQKIVDYVIPDGNGNLLNLLSVVMLSVLFLSLFIDYTKTIFMLKTGLQIDTRLILGYYKHLLRLPQSFFDNMRSGEIISRINDAVKIRTFINETLVALMVDVFTVVFAFALMFTYYWKLAVIMLIIIPLYLVIYLLYNRVNRIVQRRAMEQAAELQAQLVESINTAGTIKRFGLEELADVKTESRFITFVKTGYRSSINSIWAKTGSEAVSRTFTIILLWSGTYFVLDNVITSGELMSFYTLIGYFIGPIGALVTVNRVYQDARIAADRLFEILDMDTENTTDKIQMHKDQAGDIEFEHVSFRYGSRAEVFNDFSIRFSKGSVSAVVGESGSGKTTLAALLQNLYPLQGGHIRIGGIDIKHVDSDDLRALVCVVPQKIDLFEGSVLENITLDDYEPNIPRIMTICKDVGILDFIEALPAGFGTNIGENGVQLSGGQRQRLAIVRALYRNPEILILDEATSALDSDAELNIKKVIDYLKNAGKTVILIAHRLGTVMNADCICVLQEGRLAEQGSHQELLNRNGLYAHFWKSQTGC